MTNHPAAAAFTFFVMSVVHSVPVFAAPARTAQPQPQPHIIRGSLTQTAAGGGVWRQYFNVNDAYIVAANKDAMWFARGGVFWRFDLEAGKVDVCTSRLMHQHLDGFSYASLAEDGRFAISCRDAIYQWTPDDRWSRLPQPDGNGNAHELAFDARGTLWAFSFYNAFRWGGGVWEEALHTQQLTSIYPCNGGWFGCNRMGNTPLQGYAWFDSDFTNRTPADQSLDDLRLGGCFRIGKSTIGLFRVPDKANWHKGPYALCKISRGKFTELVKGPHIGLDFSNGECFQYELGEDVVAVCDTGGKPITTFPLPPQLETQRQNMMRSSGRSDFTRERSFMLRDGAGRYWAYNRYWNGKSWVCPMPPGGLDVIGFLDEVVLNERVVFDEARKTWIDEWVGVPGNVRAYDPNTRTGWLWKDAPSDVKGATWEKFEFARDGSQKRLDSVDLESPWEDSLQDRSGNLWIGAGRRWDGTTLHSYETGYRNRMSVEEGRPSIDVSPAGNVWMYHSQRVWLRFDSTSGDFTPAEPYNEFAFEAAGHKLSVTGARNARSYDPFGLTVARGGVFVFRDGSWQSLPSPLTRELVGNRDDQRAPVMFLAVPGRCVYKDRMLLSSSLGVFEWDMKRDHWAYLLPYQNIRAFYDAKGRRVFLADDHENLILTYEGETFVDQCEKQCCSRTRCGRRGYCTRHKSHQCVDSGGHSSSVGASQAGASQPQRMTPIELRKLIGNSLFERMGSPLAARFPDGYVVKRGMRLDLARSIFHAAGAASSSEIHNAHYPDLTFQGYLLTDNTMLYLRVRDDKIVSMGLGPVGKGYDPAWPWDDVHKNSLNSARLQPYVSSIGR